MHPRLGVVAICVTYNSVVLRFLVVICLVYKKKFRISGRFKNSIGLSSVKQGISQNIVLGLFWGSFRTILGIETWFHCEN